MVRIIPALLLFMLATARAWAASEAKPALIDFEVHAEEAHVQQQVLLTARLLAAPEMMLSTFTPPRSSDALIHPLGTPTTNETTTRNGVTYRVTEWRYALFPMKAGRLRIAAPAVKGGVSLHRGPSLPFGGNMPLGGIRSFSTSATNETIEVLPPPLASNWLPASRVELSERVQPDRNHRVGEPITRAVEIAVVGQLHTHVPHVQFDFPEGLKIYPDATQAETLDTPEGVIGRWRYQWAMVPERKGEYELPAVRLSWWDVSAKTQREAVIPARVMQVTAASAPGAASSAPALPGHATSAAAVPLRLWQGLSGLLLMILLATLLLWRRQARRAAVPVMGEQKQHRQNIAAARAAASKALEQGPPATARARLIDWGRLVLQNPHLASLKELGQAFSDPAWTLELERLDRALYGNDPAWNGLALARQLHRLRAAPAWTSTEKDHALPPLYPEASTPSLILRPALSRSRLLVMLVLPLAVAALGYILACGPRSVTAPAPLDNEARLHQQATEVLAFLRAFERMQEDMLPETAAGHQRNLGARFGGLFPRLQAEWDRVPPADRPAFLPDWLQALQRLEAALDTFSSALPRTFIRAYFRSRSAFVDGVYRLYALRGQVPGLQRYWLLDNALGDPHPAEPSSDTGIRHVEAVGGRGAYSLYVPEQYSNAQPWPLVISLHGSRGKASGSLLTWLRPAKSRGYLVIAPQSQGDTWAFEAPDQDLGSILSMLQEVRQHYNVDPQRIILTGLSDGGSFSYEIARRCPGLFAGVAPVAAALQPGLDLSTARAVPMLIVHGGRDFVFPVDLAREARLRLVQAGFRNLRYVEIPDWGHGIPYAINEQVVLPWMETLPPRSGATGECG